MEDDLVVGTVPLPLEPFETLELFGELSVLELVFLRRNSLKKGIVACECLICCTERRCLLLPANHERAHEEESGVESTNTRRLTTEAHAERC